MDYKERLEMQCCGNAVKDYGFLVGLLDRRHHAIRKIKNSIRAEGKHSDLRLCELTSNYFLLLKEAVDIIDLMNKKAYSKETKEYAQERENYLQEAGFMVTREINDILDKRETRSILDSI